MIDREQVIRKLHEYFSGKEKVAAAYLFGSVARGSQRSGSDVDVAVLFHERLSPLERFEARLEIAGNLEEILGTEVDVVDLQSADPRLIHQIFVDRILVASRDTDHRVRFEVASRRAYFDRQRYRQEYDRQVTVRLKEMAKNGR